MPRLRYSAEANEDLASIAAYIADRSGNRTIATRFTDELRHRRGDIAAASIRMGRPRPELRNDLRSVMHKNYLILFRYVDDIAEIVNVIEGHRDIPAIFRDDEQ
ncbi:MAG: toxin ParE1/3/4 [Hyphomicrobiales bacterium]|jgi:plasmid stabilization system protein ParE|nr:toxin ParE1/3/4 [Hyphomicrobiales bacterium]